MANIGFISLGCAKNQVDCERMMYRVQEAVTMYNLMWGAATLWLSIPAAL